MTGHRWDPSTVRVCLTWQAPVRCAGGQVCSLYCHLSPMCWVRAVWIRYCFGLCGWLRVWRRVVLVDVRGDIGSHKSILCFSRRMWHMVSYQSTGPSLPTKHVSMGVSSSYGRRLLIPCRRRMLLSSLTPYVLGCRRIRDAVSRPGNCWTTAPCSARVELELQRWRKDWLRSTDRT